MYAMSNLNSTEVTNCGHAAFMRFDFLPLCEWNSFLTNDPLIDWYASYQLVITAVHIGGGDHRTPPQSPEAPDTLEKVA